MPKPSDIFQGDDSKYLGEEEKKALAASQRPFSVLEINAGIDGEYGPCWELKLGFEDTGEFALILMGESERRNAKLTAWQTYLIANAGTTIGPCVYQRGRTKAGQTWSDITDA